jgi:hypothetical protein
VKSYSWQFISHSIPFVSSQATPSLCLPLGAPMAKPKNGSTGWVVFFSGSTERSLALMALVSVQFLAFPMPCTPPRLSRLRQSSLKRVLALQS